MTVSFAQEKRRKERMAQVRLNDAAHAERMQRMADFAGLPVNVFRSHKRNSLASESIIYATGQRMRAAGLKP